MRILKAVISASLVGFCLTSLGGCASYSNQESAWESYQALDAAVQKNSGSLNYRLYVSEELMAFVAEAEAYLPREELLAQITVPEWFANVDGHQERAIDGRQCLNVYGTSEQQDPMTAAIEYVPEAGQLKIRAVEILFLEDEAPGKENVWCPVRPEDV